MASGGNEAGSAYLREVMYETPTFWIDDVPPPSAAPVTSLVMAPPPPSSWMIPAVTFILVMGILAIIAAVIW
jgi:hypothetical protein